MLHAFIVPLFPLIILSMEYLLKSGFNADIKNFIGPTLASAGICFFCELTKPKVVKYKKSEKEIVETCSVRELNFITIMWIFLLLSTIGWFYANYLAVKEPDGYIMGYVASSFVGAVIYSLSLTSRFIKWGFYD